MHRRSPIMVSTTKNSNYHFMAYIYGNPQINIRPCSTCRISRGRGRTQRTRTSNRYSQGPFLDRVPRNFLIVVHKFIYKFPIVFYKSCSTITKTVHTKQFTPARKFFKNCNTTLCSKDETLQMLMRDGQQYQGSND